VGNRVLSWGGEVNHSHPSSAEGRNECSHTSSPSWHIEEEILFLTLNAYRWTLEHDTVIRIFWEVQCSNFYILV